MVKLSPMLDWHEAVRALGCVSEVHIVSVGGECKELLLVCSAERKGVPTVYCVNDRQVCVFTPDDSQPRYLDTPAGEGMYLYEPNASVMKSGLMAQVCQRYQTRMIAPNSNLFIGSEAIARFPGRGFRITATTTLNRKQLRRALDGIDRANITVRNMPLSAVQLRQRLRLKDGGTTYIFGTTQHDGSHILLVCEKI